MVSESVAGDLVEVEVSRVSTVRLNNSSQRNALSVQMMQQLTDELLRVDADPRSRVILLSAAGPAFSSGHNLEELVGRSLAEEQEVFEVCSRLMLTIENLSQPVIAVIQGPAYAAGCQLAATCDLAIASTDATFATPGVKIGLFCSTPMVALTRNVGQKRAMRMLLSGEPISATTAEEWGLVNEVVRAEELQQRAHELAERIAGSSTVPVSIGKRAFYAQINLPTSVAYAQMSQVMADNAMTCDAQEGITAFLEKRSPVWRDE